MNEHQQQLQNYIRQAFAAGQSPDLIDTQLRAAGWQEPDIQQAFAGVQAQVVPSNFVAPAEPVVAAQPLPQSNGQRRGRIRTGWQLFKASMSILNGNRYLLRYLLMTGVWVFGVTAVFIGIYLAIPTDALDTEISPLGYILSFVDYLLIYFFIALYAAGLTANVLDIFKGQHKTYAEYMHIAWSKAPALLAFSFLNATVGLILQTIAERVRYVGWIIQLVFGAIWSLGTLFTIPLIVTTDNANGFREVKGSIKFFKQTWGESITSKATVAVPIFLIELVLAILLIPLLIFGGALAGSFGVITLLILYLIVAITISVIGSFAGSLVNIALFYFATQHTVPPAFSEELLNQVFIKQKRRFFKTPAQA